MVIMLFDGKVFAREIERQIKLKLAGGDRKYKLVTFYDPDNTGSRVYTNIKAKKAEELGIEFEKVQCSRFSDQFVSKLKSWNKNSEVNGIMVQLPISEAEKLISLIDVNKDVDGLKEDSVFLPATVKAVMEILNKVANTPHSNLSPNLGERGWQVKDRMVVVGNKGEVGKRLVKVLGCVGMDKDDFDPKVLKKAEVIISATGQNGLIKPEMVKKGVVCIDVGYPKGDFDPEISKKASFFTPVPGGVGPVTVAMLFANLIRL